MATRVAVNDKNITDKNDSDGYEEQQSHPSPQKSSPHNTPPKSASQKVTSSPHDSGYKNTHPIGSRKVTENIITYHEPIFQTVANTIYETQKTLNMGKRKAEDTDNGELSSPDAKRKKIDSPKIDTGFKVKKKCSIENIIERIRNEKTQSRGGGSIGTTSNNDDVCNTTTDSVGTQKLHSPTKNTKNDEIKEKISVNNTCNILKEPKKSDEPSEVADVALDLSIKSKKSEASSSVGKVSDDSDKELTKLNTSTQNVLKSKCLKDVSDNHHKISKSVPERVNTLNEEKEKLSKNKTDKAKKFSILNKKDSVKKPDKKLSNSKLEKVRDKIKENKVIKALNKTDKTGKKKLGNKNAMDYKNEKKGKGKLDITQKKEKTAENPLNSSKSLVEKQVNKLEDKKAKRSKITSENKNSWKKQKVPIAFRRVKREASLNAATFVNIFFEKNVSPKQENKRSKSESDIKLTPRKLSMARHSFTDIFGKDAINNSNQSDNTDVFKTPKKEPISPQKVQSSSPKLLKVSLKQMDNFELEKVESKDEKKEVGSPKKPKVFISDEDFEEIVRSVLQRSTEFVKFQGNKLQSSKHKGNDKQSSFVKLKDKKKLETNSESTKKKKDSSKPGNKDTKIPMKTSNIVSKSPEEVAERKKKANLARLKKAKEILLAKELQSAKDIVEVSDDSSSSESDNDSDLQVNESDNTESDGNKRVRVKKGELCRAARTHVHVEAKTVVENTSVSPQWCECCQSNYYPSQPQQGTKVWRIKQLVDQGTLNPPELIQSASHHFIAAHARCAVRPYSSPTHVSVLDSGPYVAPLMSHGHMGCTACGCRHTGMLHTSQCQSCAILPCQRYSSTYSVSYPHGHGTYPHCGCGTCSFHSPGQPLIHQPQIPLSTEPPILVRHTVPLHDSSHPVPIQLSHTDSGIATCQVPLQISEPNIQQISHCCQLSQGEIILRTNSQSDHELIDVGRDDFVKKLVKNSKVKSKLLEDRKVSKVKNKTNITDIRIGSSSPKVKTSKNLNKFKSVKIELLSKKNTIKDEQRKKKDDFHGKSKKTVKRKLNKKENKDLNKKSNINKSDIKGGKKLTEEKEVVEDRKLYSAHGWTWEGDGIIKKITNIFDGQLVERKCFKAIQHEDGEIIHVKDCVLVCSGRKEKDIPYVAKVTNFWEDPTSKEMMMTLLWYYRPEHVEGGRRPENLENEVFAAKHLDESLVACIDDRGFVLTYNEYCRFVGDVRRMKYNLPLRKKVVPDPEEPYPSNRIPPLDVDPENMFLCRHVYDFKLKRVLKNPS